jgi:methyltransferase
VSGLYAVVGFLVLQRLAELAFAARNTRRLKARGAVEVGARHFPLLVALHTAWLAALLLLVPPETPVNPQLLGLFVMLQFARLWVIATLGRRWTTRIIVLEGEALVTRGPYRFLRHPNYLVVCCEIAVVPLMFGAWEIALVFSLLNLALLRHRTRVEDLALGRRPAQKHETNQISSRRS